MRQKRHMATAALALAGAAALAATPGRAAARADTPKSPAEQTAADTTAGSANHPTDVVYADGVVVFGADVPAVNADAAPQPAPDAASQVPPSADLTVAPATARLPQLNINVTPPRTTVELDTPFVSVAPGRDLSIRPEGLADLKRSIERGQWRADVNVLDGPLRARLSRGPEGTFGVFAQNAAPQPGQPLQPGQPPQQGDVLTVPPTPDAPGNPEQQKMLELYRAQLGGQLQMQKGSYLGVSTSPVPAPLRQHLGLSEGVGLVVDFVEKDSPAEKAGIKQYDILKKLDDQVLVNSEQLAVLVRTHKAGEEVKLGIVRGGKDQTVSAKLVERDVKPLGDIQFWQGNNPAFRGFENGFGGGGGAGSGGGAGGGGGGGAFQWQARDGRGGVFGGGGVRRGPREKTDGKPGADAKDNDKDSALQRFQSRRAQEAATERTVTVWRDNDYSLTITGSPKDRHLVATDKQGKVLYDGHIDRDGGRERDKMPKEVRARLERLEKSNKNGNANRDGNKNDNVNEDVRIETREGGDGDGDGDKEGRATQSADERRVEVRVERHEDGDKDKDNDKDADDEDKDEDDDDVRDDADKPKHEHESAAVIDRNDVLQIQIDDLQGPGVRTEKVARVRDGIVSLPYIGKVDARGLTEDQLETSIVKKYADAKLLANAAVEVKVMKNVARAPNDPPKKN